MSFNRIASIKMLALFCLIFISQIQLFASTLDTEFHHSFCKKPFVSPKIIRDLSNRENKLGTQIVAVNLMGAQGSNRYYGETTDTSPWIRHKGDHHLYEYRVVDQTKDGVYIIHQRSMKSTEFFQSILLLELKRDYGILFEGLHGIDQSPNRVFSANWGIDLGNFTTCHGGPERLLAVKLGEIPLSNSWNGTIHFKDNYLHISDLGKFQFESSRLKGIFNYVGDTIKKLFSTNRQTENSHLSLITQNILQDLHTWLSDIGDQIVSIDLLSSQSDKIIEPIQDETNFYPPFFHFGYLGEIQDNIHIFSIEEGTGGRSIFPNIILVALEQDNSMSIDWKKKFIKRDQKRILVKKLGEIQLPMNWWGPLQVKDNKLVIGNHEGVAVPLCYCENKKTAAILEFKKEGDRIFCQSRRIKE